MVPPALVPMWSNTIRQLLVGTGLELRIISGGYTPTASDLNVDDDHIARGNVIYLISYNTYRARHDKDLKDCEFGMAIFDESHWLNNDKSKGYAAVMKLDAPYRIQLTVTPMHHTVADMVVQSQWLFAQDEGDGLAKHGPRG